MPLPELALTPATPAAARAHFLHPATLFADASPHVVTTVLGTCVAVCLWDRALRIGGINHFMLPQWNGKGLASPKFGNVAVPRLIERMEKMGSKRVNLVAKLFGGKSGESEVPTLDIGARNAELAEAVLHDACIDVRARSLGGPFGRKVLFHTATGDVFVKRHDMA